MRQSSFKDISHIHTVQYPSSNLFTYLDVYTKERNSYIIQFLDCHTNLFLFEDQSIRISTLPSNVLCQVQDAEHA